MLEYLYITSKLIWYFPVCWWDLGCKRPLPHKCNHHFVTAAIIVAMRPLAPGLPPPLPMQDDQGRSIPLVLHPSAKKICEEADMAEGFGHACLLSVIFDDG